MTPEHVRQWLEAHPLTPSDVDCTTTVMLKIIDGKCKMSETEKRVMALLYDAVRDRRGERFGADLHRLIEVAHGTDDERVLDQVYEQRLLAETALSRPVMKSFKAMIRDKGLFGAERASETSWTE